MEGHTLMNFENRVLKRKFGKRSDRRMENVQNKECHNL